MNKYSAYKTCGIEWIGDIPKDWKVLKLKYIVSKVGSGITPSGGASVYQTEGIPLLRSQNIHFDGLRIDDLAFISEEIDKSMKNSRVEAGDVLLNITGASIGRCYFLEKTFGRGNVNQHVCIIRPIQELITTKFLYYLLRSNLGQLQIDLLQSGANREGLNFEQLKNFHLFVPSLYEQTAITAYLDEIIIKINTLIGNKQNLIELFKEEKAAIINEAVTKGINPHVSLKPSGIEWLGDIPSHWEVKKLKYVAEMLSGFAFSSEDFVPEGIQLVKISNLYQNELQLDRQPTFLPHNFLVEYEEYLISNGDILMSMTGTLGKRDYGFAVLIDTILPLLLNQRVSKIIINQVLDKRLAVHILRSEYFLNNLFLQPSGTKQGNFSNEQVLNQVICFPNSFEEQKEIIGYIESETARIDYTISRIEKEIELMQEYRTALISEVVTGQIKVVD